LVFDLAHVLAWRNTGPVRDAEDVSVDRDRRLAESGIENHVRRPAADAWKRLERFARARHFSAVPFDQNTAHLDDVLCLRVEESDRADVRGEPFDAELQH